MRNRGGLTWLIVFLLAPSLLFASLWFGKKFDEVDAIDRSLQGVHLIEALGPIIQERTLTGKAAQPSNNLQKNLEVFGGPERSKELTAYLEAMHQEEKVVKALRQAQALSYSIARLSDISSTSSFEASRLPHLIYHTLPSVIIESSIMVQNARSLSSREKINVWDKMSIPVQAGQFKIAADNVSRATSQYLDLLRGENVAELQEKAKTYRKANHVFQSKGANLLTSTIKAQTGNAVQAQALIEVHPDLVNASFELWKTTLNYLEQDLQKQRAETLFAVALAGLAGSLVIFAAFAIAFSLIKALVDRTQQEFENLGFHDPLTGLPNRRALLKKISSLPPSNEEERTGLILIDLRQFKKINDRFGDQHGDALLRVVASRLAKYAEPEDFISRTGGTEFTLLRPNIKTAGRFEHFAHSLLQEIGKDRQVDGEKASLDANAGLFIGRPGETTGDNILTDAALALRSAKQKGSLKLERFTPDMRAAFEENEDAAKELYEAIKGDKIVAWYQPQIDLHTEEIVGAEALVRWVDGDQVRFPGAFLPTAMKAGYMDLVDEKVRENVLQLASDLSGRTRTPIHLGLNVTANLLASAEAVNALHKQVKQYGLEPSNISLEILEAVMIDEITAAPIKENIAHLSDLGFYIELDDFGTGHSSISSLRDLKVDRVKIDRSFISGVDKNPELQKFTSALINLAKSLDISVLAEGVETEGERQWLKHTGCDVIQGFLISKAVPENQLATQILKQNFRWSAATGLMRTSQAMKANNS